MLKNNCFSFFAGAFSAVLCVLFLNIFSNSFVSAAGNEGDTQGGISGIKSAQVNELFTISYNGKKIDLGEENLLSVVRSDSSYAETYIPLRRVLEKMGFSVFWEASENAVKIYGYSDFD